MKQYIIVNTKIFDTLDYTTAVSKLLVHSAHVSVDCCLKGERKLITDWYNDGMTKIILDGKNLTKIRKIYKVAQSLELPCSLISDAGLYGCDPGTIFCCGIGPIDENDAKFLDLNKLSLFRVKQIK